MFCQAYIWDIIAEVLLVRADRALQYFNQLVSHLAVIPRFTGTSVWMDVSASPYLPGLHIAPALPDGWKCFTAI